MRAIVISLRHHDNSLWALLKWFWGSSTFRVTGTLRELDKPLVALLVGTALAQIAAGIAIIIDWVRFGTPGEWAFGLALLVSYPLVVAHLFVLGMFVRRVTYYIFHPAKLLYDAYARILRKQVKRLRRKHDFTVVAVAGDGNVAETKHVLVDMFGQSLPVRCSEYYSIDELDVLLTFFNQKRPRLRNILAWIRLIGEHTATIEHPYEPEIVVLDMNHTLLSSAKYVRSDLAIFTGVQSADGANDMLADLFRSNKQVLVDGDDTLARYLVGHDFTSYSMLSKATNAYYGETTSATLQGQTVDMQLPGISFEVSTVLLGERYARAVLAAIAAADMLGMHQQVVRRNAAALSQKDGYMHRLPGQRDSVLLDDTANTDLEAILTAVNTLQGVRAVERIVVLSSLANGEGTRQLHRIIAAACDPNKLDLIVTVGQAARRWLAPAAREVGCQVRSFTDPYKAGQYLHGHMQEKAVVLVAGSPAGVHTEETLKSLLAHPADSKKLIRQGKSWLKHKAKRFKNATL